MAAVSEKIIGEILDSLDKSITELAKGMLGNVESQDNFQDMESFLSSQYEIRLQNILKVKNSSIHHLETGMKNSTIQRKQKIFERIFSQHND